MQLLRFNLFDSAEFIVGNGSKQILKLKLELLLSIK